VEQEPNICIKVLEIVGESESKPTLHKIFFEIGGESKNQPVAFKFLGIARESKSKPSA
jgi:hypothetical protein